MSKSPKNQIEATVEDLQRVPDNAESQPAVPGWRFPVDNPDDLLE